MSKFSCAIFSVTISYFITFILNLLIINAFYENEESVFIDACCSYRFTTNFLMKLGS